MKSAAILISSCDSFSDCWKPYYHGLFKYWADCPYDVFIVTNYKDSGDKSVRAIRVGDDKGWSHNTFEALKLIAAPYVIYTHEDFWIKRDVASRAIAEYIAFMADDKADYIRLFPCPEPSYECEWDKRLGVLANDAAYRASLQVALWRKQIFLDLIREGENPWQFEIQGSVRSRKYTNRFLSVKRLRAPDGKPFHFGIDYVCTAINKGKWSKAAKEYAKDEGLTIDFSNRPSETWWHDFERSGRLGACIGRICTTTGRSVKSPSKIMKRLLGKRYSS